MAEEVFEEHKLPAEFSEQITAMLDAVHAGDIERIRKLAKGNSSLINALHPKDWPGTSLGVAAFGNQREVARVLLELGADIDVRSMPLELGAIAQCLVNPNATFVDHIAGQDILPLLLARAGERDIFTAAVLGDAERVRELLERDPELARAKDKNEWEPLLYVCASKGHLHSPEMAAGLLQCARVLLQHGADPNAHSVRPWDLPALAYALAYGHNARLARILLEAGAEPDVKESLWHSLDPLYEEGLELLLEFGADLNWRTAEGETFLMSYVRHGGGVEKAVGWLLAHGADANVSNGDGKRALDVALERGKVEVVEMLRAGQKK